MSCDVSLLSLILIVLVKSFTAAFSLRREGEIPKSYSASNGAGRRTMGFITR
jgi:hypothetical protein